MVLPPDIGLPSAAWEHLPLDAALARVAGFAALVEVYSSGRHDLLDATNRRAVAASGLQLTVHGPFQDVQPASPSERRRRQAVAMHRRHLEAAAELGALCYVVHPDYQERPRRRDGRVLTALARTLEELATCQDELGVPVVVENMPGSGRSHFVAPGDLDLDPLGLVLDTGHAAISGTLHDFLSRPQARLLHVHLHDNRGPADAHDPHRPLGHGIVDARAVVGVARAAGATVVLELLNEDDVRASIAHLQDRRIVPAG